MPAHHVKITDEMEECVKKEMEKRGLIVVFPVNVELRDHNPKLFKDGREAKEVNLRYIFSNRIEKITSSISFAPFDTQH